MKLLAVAILVSSAFAHTVTLYYESITPGVVYIIYKGTTSGVCGTAPYAQPGTETTYVDPVQIYAGQTYFYAVAAEDPVTGDISPCSPEIEAHCRKGNKQPQCAWIYK